VLIERIEALVKRGGPQVLERMHRLLLLFYAVIEQLVPG
jgi:hypothetical protein